MRNTRWLMAVVLVLAAGCCACNGDGNGTPDPDLFPHVDQSPPLPDFGPWPDLWPATDGLGKDGPQGAASLIKAVDVQGSACQDGWAATGTTASASSCSVHLEAVQLGAGAGAEPDQYGCRIESDKVEAYLYELGCDDKGKISLACAGSCGGSGVTRGSVTVPGTSCAGNWQQIASLGSGKSCVAFVGQLKLGVGSGAEPTTYGCRYDPSSGDVEAYLYEKDCDDKGKIALRCDWICAPGSSGSYGLDGTQCQNSWQPVDAGLAAGKVCVTGIQLMKLGVGSGPEPDFYGCRYDAASGKLQAQLFEQDCDDKSIELQCAYLCLE